MRLKELRRLLTFGCSGGLEVASKVGDSHECLPLQFVPPHDDEALAAPRSHTDRVSFWKHAVLGEWVEVDKLGMSTGTSHALFNEHGERDFRSKAPQAKLKLSQDKGHGTTSFHAALVNCQAWNSKSNPFFQKRAESMVERGMELTDTTNAAIRG